MITRTMTCIVCPRGCRMEVTSEGDKLISCTNNFCKRGVVYAQAEIAAPVRVLTATVATHFRHMPRLPIKTNATIPKDRVIEAMKQIKNIFIDKDVVIGEVLVSDFIEKGVDLVSCRTAKI